MSGIFLLCHTFEWKHQRGCTQKAVIKSCKHSCTLSNLPFLLLFSIYRSISVFLSPSIFFQRVKVIISHIKRLNRLKLAILEISKKCNFGLHGSSSFAKSYRYISFWNNKKLQRKWNNFNFNLFDLKKIRNISAQYAFYYKLS